MTSLFDETLINGLSYAEGVITNAEEDCLIKHLQSLKLNPFRFHGWIGNRKTASFGWQYDFDDSSFSPAALIPSWLDGAREQAARFAGLSAADLVHVLIARYDPGAGIGWHRDRDVFENVVGISLMTPATLRFRQREEKRFRRYSLEVAPRSAYLLSGEARWNWEHRILPGEQLRFSVTFRTLSKKGSLIAMQTPDPISGHGHKPPGPS